ncbi:MAG: GTPase ObgE [Mycoplasma sp.]
MAFVDQCKILFKAGNGGNGIVSWRREAHVPMGGPAGGDGGNGGSIILVGDHNENSLQYLKFKKHISAGHGENGQIKTMIGKNGDDVYVRVPVGTVVYDVETDKQIVDISESGQRFVICKGGLKGHGNFHFKSGLNKAPSMYEWGDIGEVKECRLVLKHIADIGIVGLPNAGKSTLISQISAAKPKTANYQFTTLTPILGTIFIDNEKVIFADIPGLIEGASEGHGLGHDFLRHIERTSVLIHLVSMDDEDALDPFESYETIMKELGAYSKELIKKPMLIVANKMDAPNSKEKLEEFKKHFKDVKILEASTGLGENMQVIVDEAYKLLKEIREKRKIEDPVHIIEFEKRYKPDELLDRTLHISEPLPNIWQVESEFLKYWVHRIPTNTQDNVIRLNQKLKTVGVEAKLKELGAKQGDIIRIYSVELQYEE